MSDTEKESIRAPIALWLVPAAMLLVALLPLPYGYYTLLRLVVCICAAVIAYLTFVQEDRLGIWAPAFAFVAILFNPIVPVYLDRQTWIVIDLIVAGVFATHSFLLRKKVRQRNQ